jgi:hypothetical protein
MEPCFKAHVLGAFTQSRKAPIIFVISASTSVYLVYQLGPTGRISVKFHIADFHENSSRNSKSGYNTNSISRTLQVHLTAFIFFYRRQKFVMKSFFFNTQYFYVYDSDM